MFSSISVHTHSNSIPVRPVSSADVPSSLVLVGLRSMNEFVRYGSHLLVIVSTFARGVSPASDIQETAPPVTDTPVVPDPPYSGKNPICTSLSSTFQPEKQTVAEMDSAISGSICFDVCLPRLKFSGLRTRSFKFLGLHYLYSAC